MLSFLETQKITFSHFPKHFLLLKLVLEFVSENQTTNRPCLVSRIFIAL